MTKETNSNKEKEPLQFLMGSNFFFLLRLFFVPETKLHQEMFSSPSFLFYSVVVFFVFFQMKTTAFQPDEFRTDTERATDKVMSL